MSYLLKRGYLAVENPITVNAKEFIKYNLDFDNQFLSSEDKKDEI